MTKKTIFLSFKNLYKEGGIQVRNLVLLELIYCVNQQCCPGENCPETPGDPRRPPWDPPKDPSRRISEGIWTISDGISLLVPMVCFVRSFYFLFLVYFGDKVMKILCNLCLHFPGQDGKKITQLKWPKYQKPKDENMGWRNIRVSHLLIILRKNTFEFKK